MRMISINVPIESLYNPVEEGGDVAWNRQVSALRQFGCKGFAAVNL